MPKQTVSQTVGPFFSIGMSQPGENTLVNDRTSGQRIIITGQVWDGDNQPVEDACLEIWQADASGHFSHPADPQVDQADPHFGGFGRSETRGEGFWFKTVKPGTIMDNPAPYINVRLFSRGMLIHAVTRLYFSDEAGNQQDATLNSIPPERRATLIAQRLDIEDVPTYRFDIRLQGDNETVFFDA